MDQARGWKHLGQHHSERHLRHGPLSSHSRVGIMVAFKLMSMLKTQRTKATELTSTHTKFSKRQPTKRADISNGCLLTEAIIRGGLGQ